MDGEPAAGKDGMGLEVLVRNPERHGQSPGAYITYEVCTRSTSGALAKEETTVRRRYADFVWLRAALVERCPNSFIPGLAEKEKLSPTEAFDERFMERRRADLEKFVYRVAKHPALAQCKELHMFLQARVWATESSSGLIASGSVASSNVSKMLFSLTKDADDALRRITGAGIEHSDPEHQRIQNLNAHTAKLEEQLLRIHESFKKMHKRQDGIGADCAELAPAFASLAQADGELSEAHLALSHTLEGAAKQWTDQAAIDELLLREPLREVVLSTQAAREVLKSRDAALFSLVHAKEARAKTIKELEQAHQTLQKPKSSGALGLFRETFQLDNAQDKIDVLKVKIKESDGAIADAENKLKEVSQSSQDEMQRFHLTSVFDTKALLVDYARSQVMFHEAMQRHWSNVLPRLEAVETGPTRDYLPSASTDVSDNIFGEEEIPLDGGKELLAGGSDESTEIVLQAGDDADADAALADFDDV
mmetsp:Transcript_38968/g.95883  ORF Transcript_38968/g.95883 Transcript_38968/m.95883 type:complete len:478 (+) Transcript_38968:56-1489(+)